MQRSHKQQGWTLQRTAYCQLIRDTTKVKRLENAQRIIESGDTFHNVIFRDKCSISLVQYWCTCYRKADEPMKRKPKPKHPLKVHVWAGISRHMVPQRFVSLMASWMLICSATSWRPRLFCPLEKNFRTTGSCRIMTLNIRRDEQRLSLKKKYQLVAYPHRESRSQPDRRLVA